MYKVSVVIPTVNRAALLATTLDRIEQQTVSREAYEVVVVDNLSSDGTPHVLAAKCALYPNLRTLTQPKPGAAATRNAGILAARGDIVLFIDDDIFAEPDLVEEHLKCHSAQSSSSIIGVVNSPWENASDPFLRYLQHEGIFNPYSISAGRPIDFSYYHTGNVSTPRALLRDVGMFNESFSVYGIEDIELGYRLQKGGCRMQHGAHARAHHEYYPTFEQFTGKCELAGYSLGKLIELHPELRRQFTENGKHTRLLKHFHGLYRLVSYLSHPLYRALAYAETKRHSGPVSSLLRQHYYWAIRYHFFVGYRQYLRYGQLERPPRLIELQARQRIPKLAVERHE